MTHLDTNWTPSPKQAGVLEAAQEVGLKRTITAIAEAGGVSRKSIYRWLDDDPGFADAWHSIWRGAISRHLPGVVSALIAKAQEGDVPAARLVADMAGVLKQRTQLSGPEGAPLSFAQIMDLAEQENLDAPDGEGM